MKVLVKGLQFQGFQGVSPEERVVGHRLEMDLVAEVADIFSDEITETVDYALLAEEAVALCLEVRDQTVEAACRRVGEGLLARFPLIQTLSVGLYKLAPALTLSIRAVGVEIDFQR